ncbi:hypothetical protein [Enterobacter hormaechei]|uniref:hypothetical protein n=1 Tax=Enterobacter hormaechei TaxID=158836 RepID=UPI00223F84EE|nr:hypothetical protein [Enterobacter hormaechei]
MSTITREFTKEQLQQIEAAAKEVMWPVVWSEKKARKNFSEKITPKVVLKLARIALASIEAEPVAWLLSGGGAKNHVSFDSGNAYADPLREVTPLYTAPPAPVSVPDAMDDQGGVCCEVSYADGWNACRAAMLQGADGNSPAIPDGWTGSDEANAALIMLDRIETVDSVDDDRIEGIKRIIRALAAAPKQEVK